MDPGDAAPGAIAPVAHAKPSSLDLTPPCSMYQDLRTIAELETFAEHFESQFNMDAIAEITAQGASFVSAIRSLVSAWKQANKELEKAITGHKSALETSLAEAQTPSRSGAERRSSRSQGGPATKRARKGNASLQVFLENATCMVTVDVSQDGWQQNPKGYFQESDDGEALKLAPYVIRGMEQPWATEQASPAEKIVMKMYKEFVDDFQGSMARKTHERGSRLLHGPETPPSTQDGDEWVRTHGEQMVPVGAVMPSSMAAGPLKSMCALHVWAQKSGATIAAEEKGNLWTVRYTMQGTRALAVCESFAVREFMRKKQIVGMSASQWMKDINVQNARELSKAIPLLHCTAEKGDAVFIPPGFLVMEEATSEQDIGDLKFSVVVKRDAWFQEFATKRCSNTKVQPLSHC